MTGWPSTLAGHERRISVTAMCDVPVVARQASCNGEAMAKRGAATMMRSRCWTMWSQKSSPS